jgi:hypothetical protein
MRNEQTRNRRPTLVPWESVQVLDPNTPPLEFYLATVSVLTEVGPRHQVFKLRAAPDLGPADLRVAARKLACSLGFTPTISESGDKVDKCSFREHFTSALQGGAGFSPGKSARGRKP